MPRLRCGDERGALLGGGLDGKVEWLSLENDEYDDRDEVGSRIRDPALIEQRLAQFEEDRPTRETEALAFLEPLRKDSLLKLG